MRLLERSGTWHPEDRAEEQVRALAFEVPAGVDALRVEVEHDRSGGGVIDLGCQRPDSWVGWSGGARSHFVLSEAWSTPGYLPTPVTAGEWQVVLGLHRVPPPGVAYRVTVTAVGAAEVLAERRAKPTPPPVPERPPPRQLPSLDGTRWRAGDFHAHTLHSDGALSIEELAALAVSQGLDVLAVTDHNTTSHHAHLPGVGERYGIQLVPGQEVTTDQGHANAFGDIGFVDFRMPGREWQREVAERGGVLSVNHPLAGTARGGCRSTSRRAWRRSGTRRGCCRCCAPGAVRSPGGRRGASRRWRSAAATFTGPAPTRCRVLRRRGCAVRATTSWGPSGPDERRFPPTRTGRCSCGSTTSWWRSAPTGRC